VTVPVHHGDRGARFDPKSSQRAGKLPDASAERPVIESGTVAIDDLLTQGRRHRRMEQMPDQERIPVGCRARLCETERHVNQPGSVLLPSRNETGTSSLSRRMARRQRSQQAAPDPILIIDDVPQRGAKRAATGRIEANRIAGQAQVGNCVASARRLGRNGTAGPKELLNCHQSHAQEFACTPSGCFITPELGRVEQTADSQASSPHQSAQGLAGLTAYQPNVRRDLRMVPVTPGACVVSAWRLPARGASGWRHRARAGL
jgi:hypothetical protein